MAGTVLRAHRGSSGLEAGDEIHIELRDATAPKRVDVPPESRSALEASTTFPFFSPLSNSLQRYRCSLIHGAKTDATKVRRIPKAVELSPRSGNAR